jgi:hypothetical protein
MAGPIHTDLIFEAWIVARNAFTWTHAPARMFDTEHCAPYEKTLTLGLPMITAGLFGVPATMVTRSPAAIYNFSVAVSLLLSFVAMYVLIRRWTGLTAAAIAAALLYAFHPIRIAHIHHPTVWDTTWTVFAIFFAERLFAEGRWRDAIGLGSSCALQIATSFYPLMVAAFLALPFIPWLITSYGFRKVRVAQFVAVAALIAAAAVFVLFPYLTAGIERPESYPYFLFTSWQRYWPGHEISPGWILFVSGAVAIFRGGGALRIHGDPRWALLVGAAVLAFLSVGAETARLVNSWLGTDWELWNPYLALGNVIPGLRSVRGIERLAAGVHLVACVLGAIGFAVVIHRWPRITLPVSITLVALVSAAVVRPAFPAQEPLYELRGYAVEVTESEIEFFEELGRRGNSGPIFELPKAPGRYTQRVATQRILRSFYHRRRTSSCYGSYGYELHLPIASQLPDPDALRTLRELGFTTLVAEGRRDRFRLLSAASNMPAAIRPILITKHRAAFEILPIP